jgi:hypothetical protein
MRREDEGPNDMFVDCPSLPAATSLLAGFTFWSGTATNKVDPSLFSTLAHISKQLAQQDTERKRRQQVGRVGAGAACGSFSNSKTPLVVWRMHHCRVQDTTIKFRQVRLPLQSHLSFLNTLASTCRWHVRSHAYVPCIPCVVC